MAKFSNTTLPFNRCTKKSDLLTLRHYGFARVAGIVVSKQRPGTAKGTMFMTIEDETGDINIIIWADTQKTFRKAVMTAKLVVITGKIQIADKGSAVPVIQVTAGRIDDYSERLNELGFKSRSFR